MKNKLKGGIETIIAVVVLVGLVIALIIGAILPVAEEGVELGSAGTNKLSGLTDVVEGKK